MKGKPTSVLNIRTRLSAWLLLLVFLSIPVITTFHHHQIIPAGASKSLEKVTTFHTKCAICDYTHHKDAQKLNSAFEVTGIIIKIISDVVSITEQATYFSIHLRFPSANSPPYLLIS